MRERLESLMAQLRDLFDRPDRAGEDALVVELLGYIRRGGLDWLAFANGHWQKERPTKPGDYATRTKDGYFGSRIAIYKTPDGKVGATSEWAGDWWSEPYPRFRDCKY